MSLLLQRTGRAARRPGRYSFDAYAFAPPSTVNVEPVMYLAFALARNATALAMSSAAPYRPNAMNCFNVSAVGPLAGFMSVSIEPGCTRLTVMSFEPSSRASPFVNAISADFDAAYTPSTGEGTRSAK